MKKLLAMLMAAALLLSCATVLADEEAITLKIAHIGPLTGAAAVYGNATSNGENIEVKLRLNTAGLGRSLGVEMVLYQEIDGETKFAEAYPFKVVAEDGDVLTFHLKEAIKYSGVFRYAFRVFPWNENMPHRQDFAYVRWLEY